MARIDKGTQKEAKTAQPVAGIPLKLPIQLILAALLLFFLVLWSSLPNGITFIILIGALLSCSVLLIILSVADFAGFSKNPQNLLPSIIGFIVALMLVGSPPDMLLVFLVSVYMVVSLMLVSKSIKLQTAVLLCLAVTAILFRVYPAMPGDGSMAGHLLSMDDPYYHYKQTDRLYNLGDIPEKDPTIYPPEGLNAPHKLPYYYNVYLSLLAGQSSVHDMTLLYPVLISAFGAVILFFLLKELTRDWKSGAIGGFLFATLPAILSKSIAGGIEEDLMGMVLGLFSMYLLARAIRSEGRTSTKFAVLSGIAFLMTLVSWKGFVFLFAAPILALVVYALIIIVLLVFAKLLGREFSKETSALLSRNVWPPMRATIIAGAIPIVCNFVFLARGEIDLTQIAPYGALLLFGVLAEFLRMHISGGEDPKQGLEKQYFKQATLAVVVAVLLFLFVLGIDRIFSIPQQTFEEFAGTSSKNFLVDKTISEQGALASGDIWQKLARGVSSYGMGEILTLFMAAIIPMILLYYAFSSEKERVFELLQAYLIGLMFFAIAMIFVWVEARLTFSQSLGFVLLGAMTGLLLPSNTKEAVGLKFVPLVIIIPLLLLFTFNLSAFDEANMESSWDASQRSASVDPSWFLGVKWLDKKIVPGQFVGNTYMNGDYVFTWWDYGHFITALSRSTVITDPLQADEEYIMRTARFFYNKTSEDEAIAWLMQQPWNKELKTKYIILDETLVGKASALAFLGTNYYEYPNGETAVNGVCSSGQVCQNVENGLMADFVNGEYSCAQGVVCERDQMISAIDEKKCCEETPTKCCDMSFDWHVIDEKDGSARILRSPGTAVYGQYQINPPGKYACRPEYSTKLYGDSPLHIIENGTARDVIRTYLYTGYSGLSYGNGVDYPAFVIFMYSDGDEKIKFISSNCKTTDYETVMPLGKDLLVNLGYGVKLAEGVYAPQIFVHVPNKWMNAMFTKLYLQDAKGLKYIKIFSNDETKKFYPGVKVYEITYPTEIPVANPNAPKSGDVVEVDYTGRFENGTVFDTSEGREPLSFMLGAGQLIQGFEDAVMGMEVGQTKTVTIPPEKAYGETGSHPLVGKTLVFDITLLSINKEESAPSPANETNGAELNMTFDYYDPKLKESYKISAYPTIVLDCSISRLGTVSSGGSEVDALKRMVCIASKAEPSDICTQLGISYNPENNTVLVRPDLKDLLKTIKKTGLSSCAPSANQTLVQAFYSKDCSECAQQKAALDQVSSDLAGYVTVKYYCASDESYCKSHSTTIVP